LPQLDIEDILKYRQLRSAFIAFMIDEMDDQDISYLQGSQSLLLTDTDSHVMSGKSIAKEYLKFSNSSSDDETLNHIEAVCEENEIFGIFQSLEAIQVDMIAIITIRSLHPFLLNGSWKNDNKSPISSPKGRNRIDWVKQQQPFCSFDNSMNLDEKIKSVYDLFVLDDYLVSRSLLTTLIMALKYIPVSIGIISIDKSQYSEFPIIYVNDMFVTETGYQLDTIQQMEENYFLHNNTQTESTTLTEIKTSLEYGKSIKFELTSLKQNGKAYRNFVAFKPVFDQNMSQRYMFCCMYDIDAKESSLAKIKLVDQVLTVLPDIVMLNDNELMDSCYVPLSM
jgi:hypothetical protein